MSDSTHVVANAEWVDRIDSDPREMLAVLDEFYNRVIPVCEAIKQGQLDEWNASIEELSWLLILWCDSKGHIDPTPITDFLRATENAWHAERDDDELPRLMAAMDESLDRCNWLLSRLNSLAWMKVAPKETGDFREGSTGFTKSDLLETLNMSQNCFDGYARKLGIPGKGKGNGGTPYEIREAIAIAQLTVKEGIKRHSEAAKQFLEEIKTEN